LQPLKRQSGLLYYRLRSFDQKLRLVDDALRAFLPKGTFTKHWQPHHDRALALSHTRNILAHHPVMRRGTVRDGMPGYIYTIYIEPYERILNAEYNGLVGKDELGVEDLMQHDNEIEALERDLRWFLEVVLGPQRGS
jgi:hypothetical protein